MFKPITRGVLAVITSTAFMAGESRACCFTHCFDWCKPAPVTTYAPACPAPAPACNVCPQQVNYVPQTCYRTSYTCVPVTTCKPVTTCDPCTGMPQTVMQPVTTMVRRPVIVPYTTLRPVVTTANFAPSTCSTCGGCSACSGAAYTSPYYSGSTVASYTAAPTTGCASCGSGSNVSYGAPAATYGSPAPAVTTPMYTTPGLSTPMSVPNLSAPPMGSPTPASPSSPPQTFQNSGTPQSSSSLYPTPPIQDTDPKLNSSTSAPRLLDPQNRTTSTGPMIGPATVTNAIFRTADRSRVFHPASQVSDGWTEGAPVSDGWQSADGK